MSSVPVLVLCLELLFLICPAAGDGGRDSAAGLKVDTSKRMDVLAFYHSVRGNERSAAVLSNWTGSVHELLPGATSPAFKADVLRRVNFYRALAGLQANLSLSPDKSAGAQEAALLCARNEGLSHDPAREHPQWYGLNRLPRGVAASARSNLSLGVNGTAAVDGQIRDDGAANRDVGHRRWLLSPRLQEIGIGDVPQSSDFPAANAIWVVGEPWGATPDQSVMWPNQGYFPKSLLPRRWSVSHAGADFSEATVLMRQGGENVPAEVTCRSTTPADRSPGEPTLVWEPQLAGAGDLFDVTYHVEIRGFRLDGTVRHLSYEVVAFEPNVLNETQTIKGESNVTPVGSSYTFNAVTRAEGYVLLVARGSAEPWLEGAEGSALNLQTDTSPGYDVVQSMVVHSGTSAFHLTHPDASSAGFSDQLLRLNRRLVPSPASVLQFSETGRFAEKTTSLNAEVSTDDGLTWTAVWSRTGVGLDSSLFDKGWIPHAVHLGGYRDQAVLLRFSLKSNGGPIAAGATQEHGFFLDDIVLTNSTELVDVTHTELGHTATGFHLDSRTAGGSLRSEQSYYLSIAARIGGHLFPQSALKIVKVSDGRNPHNVLGLPDSVGPEPK